jgi:hypothetical protein
MELDIREIAEMLDIDLTVIIPSDQPNADVSAPSK